MMSQKPLMSGNSQIIFMHHVETEQGHAFYFSEMTGLTLRMDVPQSQVPQTFLTGNEMTRHQILQQLLSQYEAYPVVI